MRRREAPAFHAGDWVIYSITKHTTHPGRHAREIVPSPRGDDYRYEVDKLWIVTDVRADGSLVLTTRRGKVRTIARDDPALRRPSLWERLTLRKRFPRAFTDASSRNP